MTDNLLPDIDVIWKPIIGFENYECTIDGRVRNVKRKKIINVSVKKRNRYYTLSQNNKQTQVAVSNCIKLAYPETVDKPACHCCGKEYYNTGYVNYCSKECKAENYKRFKAEYLIRSPRVYRPKPPRTLSCLRCSNQFQAKARQKYCSTECRMADNPMVLPDKPCKKCGRLILERKRGKFYCSDECKPAPVIDREYAKAYRRKMRKEGRIPRSKDKDRARFFGVEYKRVAPITIFKRDGWVCHVCSLVLDPELRGKNVALSPEIDHVIPISKGGPHIESNLACICRACNIKKSDNM